MSVPASENGKAFDLCQCITSSRLFQSQDFSDPEVRAGKLDWVEISQLMGERGAPVSADVCRRLWNHIAYGHMQHGEADSDTEEPYFQPYGGLIHEKKNPVTTAALRMRVMVSQAPCSL
jgi:hypothetical protein